MPKLYHAFVNNHSDSADSTLTRPSNWNAALNYGNSTSTGPSGTDAQIRELLSSSRTYFVATTGSDSNDGLSSGAAFLTIQKAIDTIVQTLDVGGQTITISIGSGTFTATNTFSPWTGGGSIVVDGNGSANTTVGGSADVFDFSAGSYNGYVTFQNMTITTTGNFGIRIIGNAGVYSGTGMLYSGSLGFAHVSVESPGATFFIDQAYTIGAGTTPYHIAAQYGGFIEVTRSMTVTLTGSPIFSNAFCLASMCGVFFAAAATTYSGATGASSIRYQVYANAVINTGGGGANYFPGDTAGSTASGGQYI